MSEGAIRFVVIPFCVICAVIVSYDAHRRGMNGLLWGLLIFLFSIIALPVYLLMRTPLPRMPKGNPDSSFDAAENKANAEPNAAPKKVRHPR